MQLTFIHINKTGGTSIEGAFNSKTLHMTMKEHHANGEGDWYTSFKFSFVRNPWDRMVSWFFWFNRDNVKDDGSESYLKLKSKFNRFIKNIKNSHDVELYPDTLENCDKGRWVANQVDWLKDLNGNINMNFIGRYESLQKDFNSLCKKINKPTVKLSSEKKLKGKPHYSKFYNTNSIKTIERLYKDDIKYFNYEF